MKKRDRISILTYFLFFSLLLLATGCSIFSKNAGQAPSPESQAEKPPRQVEEIEKTMETLFKTHNGPALGENQTQSSASPSEQNQDKSSIDPNKTNQAKTDQTKEKSDSPSSGASEQTASNASSQNQATNQASDPDIQTLHQSWNALLPALIKKQASKELIDNFSNALNDLTKITTGKDNNAILLALNQLYQNIPEIYALYKTENSAELKRLIYYTRSAILYAKVGDWTKADKAMNDLQALWSIIKNAVAKDKQEDAIKLDLSLYELAKVIKDKDKDLVAIKGKLTLTNTEALQNQKN